MQALGEAQSAALDFHAPIADGGEVVAVAPAGGIGLVPVIDEPGFEGLVERGGVAEIFDPDLVEIIEALAGGQILAPVIGIALEGEALARLHGRDDIGAGAHGDGEARFAEPFHIRVLLRQHRHQGEDQRQFEIPRAGQIIAHGQVVRGLQSLHQGEGGAILRPPFALQELEGEAYVPGGDRRSIGKARARIEAEGHMGAVGVGLDGLCDLAVEGEGLVQIARHKRLENIAIEPLGGGARLQVEGVEAVEGALGANHQPPTFGGVGVGVGQVGEVGRQRRFAMHGDSMGGLPRKGSAGSRRKDRQERPDKEANRSFFHGPRLKKCACRVIVGLSALNWSFFSP